MKTSVCIIGGGPCGASAARYLAGKDIANILVDMSAPDSYKIGEGLVPGAKVLLQDLGIWDRFSKAGHLPSYGNESAWGTTESYGTDFIRSPYGHGWHLDRTQFDALLRTMAGEAGTELWLESQLTNFHYEKGHWELEIKTHDQQRKIQCNWLIDATGRSHRIARKLRIARQYEDQLIAFYARFEAGRSGDEDGQSFIEAVPEGWWYTALLPDGYRTVVFFTDADLPWVAEAQQPAGFKKLLGQTHLLKDKLGEFDYQAIEAPKGTDARTSRLACFSGEGWLASGDAAMSFDPLSSQGILTALYAGLKSGQAIEMAIQGETDAFAKYAQNLDQIYHHFLLNRLRYYQLEQRWTEAAFWKKRQAEVPNTASVLST